jgi:hypothetical protein
MEEYKQGLCRLDARLLVDSKIRGALITAVEVCREVINMEKRRCGTWSVQ